MPPFVAGLMTAVVAFAILELQTRGLPQVRAGDRRLPRDRLPRLHVRPAAGRRGPRRAFAAGLVPHFDGTDSVLLAVGILGATVMPHVVYLHSALTSAPDHAARTTAEQRELLRFQRLDVVARDGPRRRHQPDDAASSPRELFHDSGRTGVDSIEGAHAGFNALLGGGAALAFAVALLASGLSSSSVGTFAGQVVMQGFINRRIPLFLRRAITMAPSLVVLAIGVNPSTTLVISQVVLSLRHPVRARADGAAHAPRGHHGRARQPALTTTVVASIVAAMIICLNVFLLYETFFG